MGMVLLYGGWLANLQSLLSRLAPCCDRRMSSALDNMTA